MSVILSKLTSKAQTTIPKDVRRALDLQSGDAIAYHIQDGHVVMSKADTCREAYYEMLNRTFSEWDTPEDDEAFAYLSEVVKPGR